MKICLSSYILFFLFLLVHPISHGQVRSQETKIQNLEVVFLDQSARIIRNNLKVFNKNEREFFLQLMIQTAQYKEPLKRVDIFTKQTLEYIQNNNLNRSISLEDFSNFLNSLVKLKLRSRQNYIHFPLLKYFNPDYILGYLYIYQNNDNKYLKNLLKESNHNNEIMKLGFIIYQRIQSNSLKSFDFKKMSEEEKAISFESDILEHTLFQYRESMLFQQRKISSENN